MPQASTAVAFQFSFHIWMPLGTIEEVYDATVTLEGRTYRIALERMYGKLDSAEVHGLDWLSVHTELPVAFDVADLARQAGHDSARALVSAEVETLRLPIRGLVTRTIEFLRLERPDLDLGLTADRAPHQTFARENSILAWAPSAGPTRREPGRSGAFPLFEWTAGETTPDVDSLPRLQPADLHQAAANAAAKNPDYSRLQRRDAEDHRRAGDLRICVILAVCACETRYREVATSKFSPGWTALLSHNSKPTFGAARNAEMTVFGSSYNAHDAIADQDMKDATTLRNDLIHNALTIPEPTEAEADAALSAADHYLAWLDTL
jgi:hypothetical protein